MARERTSYDWNGIQLVIAIEALCRVLMVVGSVTIFAEYGNVISASIDQVATFPYFALCATCVDDWTKVTALTNYKLRSGLVLQFYRVWRCDVIVVTLQFLHTASSCTFGTNADSEDSTLIEKPFPT